LALSAVDHAMMINTNAAVVLAFDALARRICGVCARPSGRFMQIEPVI
jgi:hypothetical protein